MILQQRKPLRPKREKPRRKENPIKVYGAMEHNRIKNGVYRDERWLDAIRSQQIACAITGRYGSDMDQIVPMHIGITGKGCKAPDNHVLPALDSEHRESHGQIVKGGFQEYWCRKFMEDKHLLLDVLRAYAEKQHEQWEKSNEQ